MSSEAAPSPTIPLPALRVPPLPTVAARPLAEQLREAARTGKLTLPALPEVLLKLRVLLDDESGADIRAVSTLVRHDQAIAAALLRMANSAIYAGMSPVSDLLQAVGRLGLRQIDSAVTALVYKGQFTAETTEQAEYVAKLWAHAVHAALAARHIARHVGTDAEPAFLAGLLHDAGKLVVLRGLGQVERRPGAPPVTPAVRDELIDILHAEMGCFALRAWNIPEGVCDATLHHHDPAPQPHSLAALVQSADLIAHRLLAEADSLRELDSVCQSFQLSELELATMLVDIEDEYAAVQELL